VSVKKFLLLTLHIFLFIYLFIPSLSVLLIGHWSAVLFSLVKFLCTIFLSTICRKNVRLQNVLSMLYLATKQNWTDLSLTHWSLVNSSVQWYFDVCSCCLVPLTAAICVAIFFCSSFPQ